MCLAGGKGSCRARISQPAEEKPQGHGKERGKGTQEARSHLSHSEGNQKRRQGKQRKYIQKIPKKNKKKKESKGKPNTNGKPNKEKAKQNNKWNTKRKQKEVSKGKIKMEDQEG